MSMNIEKSFLSNLMQNSTICDFYMLCLKIRKLYESLPENLKHRFISGLKLYITNQGEDHDSDVTQIASMLACLGYHVEKYGTYEVKTVNEINKSLNESVNISEDVAKKVRDINQNPSIINLNKLGKVPKYSINKQSSVVKNGISKETKTNEPIIKQNVISITPIKKSDLNLKYEAGRSKNINTVGNKDLKQETKVDNDKKSVSASDNLVSKQIIIKPVPIKRIYNISTSVKGVRDNSAGTPFPAIPTETLQENDKNKPNYSNKNNDNNINQDKGIINEKQSTDTNKNPTNVQDNIDSKKEVTVKTNTPDTNKNNNNNNNSDNIKIEKANVVKSNDSSLSLESQLHNLSKIKVRGVKNTVISDNKAEKKEKMKKRTRMNM
jgi:hypothetical protein